MGGDQTPIGRMNAYLGGTLLYELGLGDGAGGRQGGGAGGGKEGGRVYVPGSKYCMF